MVGGTSHGLKVKAVEESLLWPQILVSDLFTLRVQVWHWINYTVPGSCKSCCCCWWRGEGRYGPIVIVAGEKAL